MLTHGTGSYVSKDCISKEFTKLASISLKEHPESILYNLWMDIVCDILKKSH